MRKTGNSIAAHRSAHTRRRRPLSVVNDLSLASFVSRPISWICGRRLTKSVAEHAVTIIYVVVKLPCILLFFRTSIPNFEQVEKKTKGASEGMLSLAISEHYRHIDTDIQWFLIRPSNAMHFNKQTSWGNYSSEGMTFNYYSPIINYAP